MTRSKQNVAKPKDFVPPAVLKAPSVLQKSAPAVVYDRTEERKAVNEQQRLKQKMREC